MLCKSNTALLTTTVLLLCLMINSCVKEYPPFDEYQIVGSAPIDTVRYGRIFLAGERLYALYDTSYYDRWHLLREYDIADPRQNPHLICVEEITPLLRTYYRHYQDSLVFFESYYHGLMIFNLRTRESYAIDLDFNVYDIAYAQNHLFVSSYSGLRVYDITDLPNYLEVFNDSVTRHRPFIVLKDTLLLEIYDESGYGFKFWNVAHPDQPQVIIEGELPDPPRQMTGVGLTDQFVICFDYAALHRYRYDLNGPVNYEATLNFDFSYYYQAVSDSLVYVADGDHIEIISIGDLSTMQIGLGDPYTEGILSIDILGERIYVLIRNRGIQVYERREP